MTDGQPGFAGGLNVSADEAALEPTECRRTDNAELTERGAVTRRGGSQRLTAAALADFPVRGGFAWQKADGTVEELVVVNGTLYTGTYGVGMTFTAQVGSLSTTATPSFAAFRDGSGECVYIADGGLLNKWDGATLTVNLAGTPNTSVVWVYNQRLYGVGDTAAPQTLSMSAINNGDSLGIAASGGERAVVRTFGDQKLTGGCAMGGANLLFHVSGISVFTGLTQDDINISAGSRGLTQDVGTIAPRSIVPLENAVLFLSERGVYAATAGGVVPLAGPIEAAITTFSRGDFGRVAAAHHRAKRQVLFYLPDVGIYAYHYRVERGEGAGAWAGPWTGGLISPATHALWESQDDSGRPIVLRGDASGWVSRLDMPLVYRDNVTSAGTGGDAYALAAQCHRMDGGDAAGEVAWKWAYVTAALRGSTAASLSWSTPTASGSETITTEQTGAGVWGVDDGTWGTDDGVWSSGGLRTYRVPLTGRGPIDLTINDDGAAGSLVSRVELEGHYMGRRRR